MKRSFLGVMLTFALAPLIRAAGPAFEVATIRPSAPESRLGIYITSGRTFNTRAATLHDIICYAYAIHSTQVIDGPAWLSTDRFDVTAQAEPNAQVNTDILRAMVQSLLAERFGLSFHRDQRPLPAYRITVAKDGPKLPALSPNQVLPATVGLAGGRGAISTKNSTLSEFANFLQRYILDRPVVNATTIQGKYDLDLRWRPDEGQYLNRAVEGLPPLDNAANLPDVFGAMREQLGLRFEAVKAPIEVLVVDRVNKPSEN